MNELNLADFDALTFDCYGTLVNWEIGILAVLGPWARRAGVNADDADLLAAFAEEEPRQQQKTPGAPYPQILADVHRAIAIRYNVGIDDNEVRRLGESIGDWPPFDDTPAALRRLQRRYKLLVLSNVDRASFARTAARLGIGFDAVITAEDVGSYKPAPAHFTTALAVLATLGVAKDRVLHVAQSLYHDHVPAKKLGLRTCWVNRDTGLPKSAAREPEENVRPDLIVATLEELAEMAEAVGIKRDVGPSQRDAG